ncbi:MAG TPA: hypothetical protein PK910_07830 [Bacteroidales bacterium]|nr:hypothetical protein [Bacteroidales bacterium]
MKKFLTTILIVCISSLAFPQSFYKYKGKQIDLIKDSSTFLIQTYNHLFENLNSSLEEQFQKGEIDFFQKMPNSRFLVIGNKPKLEYYFFLLLSDF